MALRLTPGEVLDNRYRLGGRLGGGNFGTVYRAEELMNGAPVREVALKLYTPKATECGDVEGMFADCALPAKILSSTVSAQVKQHFVQIFGWGILPTPIGDCAFVSMELVRNASTLEDLIERHNRSGLRPTEDEVLEIMQQFFAALAVAHGAGVLHRDIKGANVMLSDGIVKIVDFGMGARMSDGDTPLKTTMSIYAPENFEGKYSMASDIFQAGLLFYQYWTGVQPFEKEIFQLKEESDVDYSQRMMREAKQMRLAWHYRPGSEMIGMVKSPKLDAILAKCLTFSEAGRYENAMMVLPALKASNLSLVQGAWEAGDTEYAKSVATEALDNPKTSDKNRVDLIRILGDIEKERGEVKNAREHYLQAFKLAERCGAYFLAKRQMRELLEQLAECFEATGQQGMAGLYRKKISLYK